MTAADTERARVALEDAAEPGIRAALLNQANAVALAAANEDYPLTDALDDAPLRDALEALYTDSIAEFADVVTTDLSAQSGKQAYADTSAQCGTCASYQARDTSFGRCRNIAARRNSQTQHVNDTCARHSAKAKALSVWLAAIQDFIAGDGGRMLAAIRRTTLEAVRAVVNEAQQANLGPAETARLLRDALTNQAPMRARRIARTEAVRASNHGAYVAALRYEAETGQTVTKTWNAVEDGVTRPTHAALNGVSVPVAGTFDVGGVAARYPGDTALPPKDSINCRCFVSFGTTTRHWRDARNERIRQDYPALRDRIGQQGAFDLLANREMQRTRSPLSPDTVRDIVYKKPA